MPSYDHEPHFPDQSVAIYDGVLTPTCDRFVGHIDGKDVYWCTEYHQWVVVTNKDGDYLSAQRMNLAELAWPCTRHHSVVRHGVDL